MTTGPCSGRTVLVTGGSRGIGAATVRALHRDGAHVVVHCGFTRSSAERLVAELGRRATVVCGDLRDSTQCLTVWNEALAWRGSIDVLVNNAGAWLLSPVADADAWRQGWGDNLALNLLAPAELCRLAIVHFSSRSGGVIVNVVSRSAHRGDDADHLAYGAAKGGLLALTKGIARGFGADRVLAYAVAPGWVATDLAAESDLTAAAASLPLGEITPAQDVAEVIAFLASGRSAHTTGATIDITGADYVR
jgi:3-oxoacyl-[acyl-carrier protein] reductase